MKLLSNDNLTTILTLLGERLEIAAPQKKWHLVVCGGTALAVLNLVNRTTRDIDIIGCVKNGKIEYAEFDKTLKEQIAVCASLFDLPPNWMNCGPESYLQTGLPDGIVDRLVWKTYGMTLRAGFISRIDQIYFKLYASVDRGGYHIDDLMALKPTKQEIQNAVTWVTAQDPSEGFAQLLKLLLPQLGFHDAARKI